MTRFAKARWFAAAVCALACLLCLALAVRSFHISEVLILQHPPRTIFVSSQFGVLQVRNAEYFPRDGNVHNSRLADLVPTVYRPIKQFSFKWNDVRLPHWLVVLFTGSAAALLTAKRFWQFNLRSLLLLLTFAAVVLTLAVHTTASLRV